MVDVPGVDEIPAKRQLAGARRREPNHLLRQINRGQIVDRIGRGAHSLFRDRRRRTLCARTDYAPRAVPARSSSGASPSSFATIQRQRRRVPLEGAAAKLLLEMPS